LPALTILLLLLHLVLAFSTLNECRRSAAYHKTLENLANHGSG
jgi:uncharacterized membrane protein YqjE